MGFVLLERLGKLRDAPRDAMIMDYAKKRGKGFGLHQMLDTSGAILGTILVIFLFWKFIGQSWQKKSLTWRLSIIFNNNFIICFFNK